MISSDLIDLSDFEVEEKIDSKVLCSCFFRYTKWKIYKIFNIKNRTLENIQLHQDSKEPMHTVHHKSSININILNQEMFMHMA